MNKMLLKEAIKEIFVSKKRFFSIMIIVLLGVGFFVGMKYTSSDMKITLDKHFKSNKMLDIQIMSSLGLEKNDIKALKKIDGVKEVEGAYSEAATATIDKKDVTIVVNSITKNTALLDVTDGRMAVTKNECILDKKYAKDFDVSLGAKVRISTELYDGFLVNKEYTVVGFANSPTYISSVRGYTKIGTGLIDCYIYVPEECINFDVYTIAYVLTDNDSYSFSKEYDEYISKIKEDVTAISKVRVKVRYDEVLNEVKKELYKAKREYEEKKTNAEEQLAEAETKITSGEEQIKKYNEEIATKEEKLNTETSNTQKKIEYVEAALTKAKKELSGLETAYTSRYNTSVKNLKKLKELKVKYDKANANIATLESQIAAKTQQRNSLNPFYYAKKREELLNEINALKVKLVTAQATKATIEAAIGAYGIKASNLNSAIVAYEKQIATMESNIKTVKSQVKSYENQISTAKKTLATNKAKYEKQIQDAKTQIEKKTQELEEKKTQLKEARTKYETEMEVANIKLARAEEEMYELQEPKWYIQDRNDNEGYNSFLQDSERVNNIGKVFPIVFFVVAVLVSLNSMTRMVREQRLQIGTLKAMGYENHQIAAKYIIYSSVATIVGGLVGMAIGFNVIPKTIYQVYKLVYTVPDLTVNYSLEYSVIGMVAAMLCTIGATIVVIAKDLKQVPAALMRPIPPKEGKRVFVEKIKFIWNRLSFTDKVTVRNLFRYKKRFLMTVVGVCGCTALVLAGFGLRDAVAYIIPEQYGNVFKFGIQLGYNASAEQEKILAKQEEMARMEEITDIMPINVQTVTASCNGKKESVQMVVPLNTSEIDKYVVLRDRSSHEEYNLSGKKLIITEKLAKILGVKAGEKLSLKDVDEKEYEVEITHVTENYVLHYVYMSPELYNQIYSSEPNINGALIKLNNLTIEEEQALGRKILKNDATISSLLFLSSSETVSKQVMNSMSLVVWMLIVAAGLLDFVVLYNLANINISERIRELATIKVLGFYDKEVYNYIGRETMILTIIGIILGLVFGTVLNIFITETCEINMIFFAKKIKIISYVYSVLCTALFTIIVNVVTYMSLKKINMMEALKSVD